MSEFTDTYAIIVAAGTGSRFGSDIPKQFLPSGSDGTPVLMRTVQVFLRAGIPESNIVVVLSDSMTDFWHELCRKHNFRSPLTVSGGATRFESVRNALAALNCAPCDRILIHDGVRPLVSEHLIDSAHAELDSALAVITVVPVTSSLRKKCRDGETVAVDRSDYLEVQTPQAFRADILLKAYGQPYRPEFTDDASVVESIGVRVAHISGEPTNIKITNPLDLAVANALLAAGDKHGK